MAVIETKFTSVFCVNDVLERMLPRVRHLLYVIKGGSLKINNKIIVIVNDVIEIFESTFDIRETRMKDCSKNRGSWVRLYVFVCQRLRSFGLGAVGK